MDLEFTINNIVTGYHHAIEKLCTGLFADPYFDVEFCGYGFNGCPVSTGVVQDMVEVSTLVQNGDVEENLGFISNYGSIIYHVLKNAVAVPYSYSVSDNKTTASLKHIFYINETDNDTSFDLSINTSSFGDIQELYNKQFKLASAIKSSSNGLNKSPHHTVDSFLANKQLCNYVGNLSIIRPKLLFTLQRNGENGIVVKSHPVSHLGDDMQGLKSVFTLFCPVWPTISSSFINRTRKHNWPDKDLIKTIIEQGIHIVPCDQNKTAGKWRYCFHNSENMLIKSISDNGKELYKMTVGLIEPIQQICLIESSVLYQAFVHCLFWFLEDGADQNVHLNSVDDDKLYLSKFLTYVLKFLSGDKIPHYFVEDKDILKDCSVDAVSQFQIALQNLVSDDLEFLDELLFDTHIVHSVGAFLECHDESKIEQIQECIEQKTIETLLSAYKGTLHIAYLLLFARLNTRESINDSIEYHQDLVSTLVQSEIMLKDWIKQLVLSSLADLYLTCALRIDSGDKSCVYTDLVSSDDLLCKAQEIMEEILDMDAQSALVKLANFYFMTGDYQHSLQFCDRVISQTSNMHLYNPVFQANNIETHFLDVVLKKGITLELLYSKYECIPPFLSRSLNLTKSSILGVTNAKVYILDADVIAGILHAMNLYYLGQTESALVELRSYENLWNKYQIDSNEKRNVAYVNAAALCYIEIGQIEKGEAILKESKKKISGFLNPARLLLIGQDYKRLKASLWQYVTRAGSVALVVTALAVIGGVYRYKTVV